MNSGFGQFTAAELEDACAACQENYNYRSMNCGMGSAERPDFVTRTRP
jgi:hypothetical protein